MEHDCTEPNDGDHSPSGGDSSPSMQELANLLNSWSPQIISQNVQLSNDFHTVLATNASFKQEVRSELDELRGMISDLKNPTVATSAPVSTQSNQVSLVPDQASTTVPITPSPSTSNDSLSSSLSATPTDQQSQMMMIFANSMAKLSSVLSDKSESTSDWPKFSGDQKKFRAWHLAILAQLSLPPWVEFYDSSSNDIICSTSNTSLNGKLYSKLLLALEGQALQSMVSRKHLRANGLQLLHELVQTYKPKNVPEVIAFKTSEFWGNTKRFPSESIDEYYNRFHDLLDDLAEADEPISVKSAIRHFIFTLGADFETLQNNFRLDNLPPKWTTQDWPTILVLCRDYYNSVKPQGLSKHGLSTPTFDREAHQQKIKLWFANPGKFSKELENEQKKYPGKCVYHLSKSHPTEKCHIKRELDKSIPTNQRQPVPNVITTPVRQLRHVTEEVFDVEEDDMVTTVEPIEFVNDTNEESWLYFARLSRHYLRLVTATSSKDLVPHHNMPFPVIADSGANYHMFRDQSFFETLQPASGTVLLGAGVTTLSIQGVGTVRCKVSPNVLHIPNVQFIPDLSESIYSLFQHIQTKEHGLESSYDDGLFIIFPSFRMKAIIGTDDIYLDFLPDTDSTVDSSSTSTSINSPSLEKCHHITEFHQDITQEISKIDQLLQQLRDYYTTVKTKRQLGLDAPAGFRRDPTSSQNYRYATPPRKTSLPSLDDLDLSQFLPENLLESDVTTPVHSNVSTTLTPTTTSSIPPSQIPIVRSVDKVSSTLPEVISMSEDFLRGCVGYRRVDTLKQHLDHLYQPTIKLDSTPPDAILDAGDFATMRKKPRNTVPVPRSTYFGDVIHMDIIFGPEISIGNVHYGIIFTDRHSRMTYIYPLSNLTSEIPRQLQAFFAHIGQTPKRLITDFDLKLIGGKARDYLNGLLIQIKMVWPNDIGKTLTNMARNWLASAELPASFWFYAVRRRAAEICKLFPTLS